MRWLVLTTFVPIALFFVVAAVFGLVPLILARFLAPCRPSRVKLQPYESGVETIGPTHIQFRTRYYLYALIFVIFDVEVMYLFPWGVAFNSLGLASLIKMVIFIAFLLVGLAYAWKKGALELGVGRVLTEVSPNMTSFPRPNTRLRSKADASDRARLPGSPAGRRSVPSPASPYRPSSRATRWSSRSTR